MTGDIIQPLSGTSFEDYYYFAVLIPNGVACSIYGAGLPSMAAPVTVNVGISNKSDVTGNVFLIGRKKPEYMADLLSNDPGNADGTYSIR